MKKVFTKERVRDTAKVLCFILVFVLLLGLTSHWFFTEKTAVSYYHISRDAYSYVREPDNTLDAVAVGNSDIYSAFSPLDLWNEYGYTSIVCASPKQTAQDSYYFMKRIFEKQRPKLVIIETDMFFSYSTRYEKALIRKGKAPNCFDDLDPEYLDDEISPLFPIFQHHNVWQGDSKLSLLKQICRGYKYNDTVVRVKPRRYLKPTKEKSKISPVVIGYMDRLVNLCKENGAEVMLAEVPTVLAWDGRRLNAVKDYAQSRKLDFVDLNTRFRELKLSFRKSFRDKGNHLNYSGAKSVTKWLGIYMSSYDIKLRKSEEVARRWDRDYALFQEYISQPHEEE